MNERIMIVDDDLKIGSLLKSYLEGFGYKVSSFTHPDDALDKLNTSKFDMIILDVMMPGKDGFEVCRIIRKTSKVPIIMLTARGEVTDRIVGIELGADDYIAKPFEPRELLVRMQAIFRRTDTSNNDEIINHGDLSINLSTVTATLEGDDLNLSTAEFAVLKVFSQNPGRTFNRDQLIASLHGDDWASFDRSIDVLVSRLRQKLKDHPKNPKFIRTVWGTGYRYIGHAQNNGDT